ncbi:MAG: hypothetical protein ACPGSD_01735 [Flavobacteriales bacterium]
MKKVYLILILLIFFSSCFDLFDPSYWKDGNYIVSTNSGEPGCLSLTNDSFVILDCVKQIGSNKNYIIATKKKKNGLQYWLIKKTKNSYKQKKQGPYNLSQFNKVKKDLSITELKFDKNFGKD